MINKISKIGPLLKKIYKIYTLELLDLLEIKGFSDLRPSFLEVLLYICEHPLATSKEIGIGLDLKKQTMTGHLKELESRGYILRESNLKDKREQIIIFTEYGQKFKFSLAESLDILEMRLCEKMGAVELERIELILENLYHKITHN